MSQTDEGITLAISDTGVSLGGVRISHAQARRLAFELVKTYLRSEFERREIFISTKQFPDWRDRTGHEATDIFKRSRP